MFFDMHMDIWTNCTWEYEKGNKDCIRKKFKNKFKAGNMLGGIFVIWLDEYDNPEKRFQQMLKVTLEELEYTKDFLKVIKNPKDFYNINNNEFGVILGIEGLSGIGKNIDYIYNLKKLGFRHLGLTWNESNEIATGQNGDVNRGITSLGIEAIKIMNELNMIIDLSHCNDKSFWDVVKYTKKPFMVSHSNSRVLCPSMRNLTDEQLYAIKDNGGIVGVNAYHNFVKIGNEEKTLNMLLDHLEYIAEKIGIDKVGFGFDFSDYYEKIPTGKGDLIDLKDATELNNIIKNLKNRGFSQNDIDKVCYKNVISFFEKLKKGEN